MFNISSASSKTEYWILVISTNLRLIISFIRPGVATITCAPRFTSRAWSVMLAPPYIAVTFNPLHTYRRLSFRLQFANKAHALEIKLNLESYDC